MLKEFPITCKGAMDCASPACVRSCAQQITATNTISCRRENVGGLVAVGTRETVIARLGRRCSDRFAVSWRARSVLVLVGIPGEPEASSVVDFRLILWNY